MKLLTTRSVDYLQKPGHDFWKETELAAELFHFFGGALNTTKPQSSSIIFERKQTIDTADISETLQLTPKQSR